MRKIIYTVLGILFVFQSCKDNDDQVYISTDLDVVQVPADGGLFSVSVKSAGAWEAVAEQVGWFTLDYNVQQRNGSFYITIDPNASRDPRSSTISVKGAGNDVHTVKVEQAGRSNEAPSLIDVTHTPGDRIPSVAWYGVYNNLSDLDARYKELKECGFTVNLADFGSTDYVRAWYTLELAKLNGMKTYVDARAWKAAPSEMKTNIKSHPALAGYYVRDEPGANEFAAVNQMVKEVQAFDNQNLCYVNLFGNGAQPNQTNTATYLEYVQRYTQEFTNLPYISFDHYSITLKNGVRVLAPNYFENYEIVYKEAKRTNKELWGFTCSVAHFDSPIATLSDLRLQIYTALAYGAQQIQFFTYWTPPSNGEGFNNAPIDLVGNKTPTYNVVRTMNNEIKNLSKVFLGTESVWVAYTGVVPQGCTALNKANLPDIFESLDISGGKGGLVSYHQKGEDRFLVVVNQDVNESINVKATGKDGLCRIKKDGSVVLVDENIHALTAGDVIVYFWKEQ